MAWNVPLSRIGHLVLVLLLASACSASAEGKAPGETVPPLASLPEDPCDLLDAEEVSAAAGIEVTSSRRVPDIGEVMESQQEGREPGPGRICSYDTASEFGEINLWVPPSAERTAEIYWDERDRYFETFPGSAEPVPGLGEDAWLGGGASLRVLIGDGEHFTVSTQRPGQEPQESKDVLIAIAQAVLERF